MSKKIAIRFIVILGIVSLFADITYEGARSITGPFLSLLGASGTAVGITVGLGELFGYGIRFFSGYYSDKTERYWAFALIGYFINLFAVPLLAFAGNWQIAAFLIILERFGKAIRVPARDTLLSYATKETGRGWGFGLHETMDQIGALVGPLAIALVLWKTGSYRLSFLILFIPAILAMLVLLKARLSYPSPHLLEKNPPIVPEEFQKKFWIYMLAVGLVGAGFAQYTFIAFHFHKVASVSSEWIPVFYAIAMAVDGLSALVMGRLFDIKGIPILAIVTFFSAFFAPLVFFGDFTLALAGMVLWGIGMGSHETIMRAVVVDFVSHKKRASAYGILNLVFGVCWFIGSSIMGFLYDISLLALVLFSLGIQIASIPLFLLLKKR